MGGGPAAAMSILWFSMLQKVGFNMKYVGYYLIARLAMLSLQLSISPQPTKANFQTIMGHNILDWITSIHDSLTRTTKVRKS